MHPHQAFKLADDIWIAWVEYNTEMARIATDYWMLMAKDATTQAIYGDVKGSFNLGD